MWSLQTWGRAGGGSSPHGRLQSWSRREGRSEHRSGGPDRSSGGGGGGAEGAPKQRSCSPGSGLEGPAGTGGTGGEGRDTAASPLNTRTSQRLRASEDARGECKVQGRRSDGAREARGGRGLGPGPPKCGGQRTALSPASSPPRRGSGGVQGSVGAGLLVPWPSPAGPGRPASPRARGGCSPPQHLHRALHGAHRAWHSSFPGLSPSPG